MYWVWQKLMFVLGGLMLPLEFYPAFIQRIAAFTPFPALLAGRRRSCWKRLSCRAGALAGALVIWSAVTAFAVSWMFRRAVSTGDDQWRLIPCRSHEPWSRPT